MKWLKNSHNFLCSYFFFLVLSKNKNKNIEFANFFVCGFGVDCAYISHEIFILIIIIFIMIGTIVYVTTKF